MSLDDDLWILGMFSTNTFVSFICFILTIAALIWYSMQAASCPENTTYFKEKNVCIDNAAIHKPKD